jgi:hypothetical protein
LRKLTPRIFQVAERLLKAQGDGRGAAIFEKGLEGNSWALPEQLTLGELLARNGQPQALQQKAEMVLRVGEEDDVLRRASHLLGRARPPSRRHSPRSRSRARALSRSRRERKPLCAEDLRESWRNGWESPCGSFLSM